MFPYLLAAIAARPKQLPEETVSLFGTAVAPRTVISTAFGGADAKCSWVVAGTFSIPNGILRGYVGKAQWINNDQAVYTSVDSPEAWVEPKDYQNGPYYVRGTLESGDTPNLPGSDQLGVWLKLENNVDNRFWGWQETGTFGTTQGTVKIEIADDAVGTTILATGYYKGFCETEP